MYESEIKTKKNLFLVVSYVQISRIRFYLRIRIWRTEENIVFRLSWKIGKIVLTCYGSGTSQWEFSENEKIKDGRHFGDGSTPHLLGIKWPWYIVQMV